jgi:uncharacterized peroxidase-related enzyme
MPRIPALDPTRATGRAKTLFDGITSKLGRVPNLMRTMGQAPAALDGYLALSGALANGSFSAKQRELIALAVAEANLCNYCLAAHTAIGGMMGVGEAELAAARSAHSSDLRTQALLEVAKQLVVTRGHLRDTDLAAARSAGLGDGDVIEVTALVALNVFTNYVNHVADTTLDFPVAPKLTAASCSTGTCSGH